MNLLEVYSLLNEENNLNQQYQQQQLQNQQQNTQQKRPDADDKEIYLESFPEYKKFKSFYKPFYKKLWEIAKNQNEKQQAKVINNIIGNAAIYLGLNWDWIKDDTYLFGFFKQNGSVKNMVIKVPYKFTFPSLKTKIVNWFISQKENNNKTPKITVDNTK